MKSAQKTEWLLIIKSQSVYNNFPLNLSLFFLYFFIFQITLFNLFEPELDAQ